MDLREFEEVGNGGEWGAWAGVEAGTCGSGSNDGMGQVDSSGGRERKRKRMIGVELENAPLCETCEIETAGAPYAEVVERGLETVSRLDGGLSRDRLDMLSEEKAETKRASRSRWKRSRFGGSIGLKGELKRFINGSTSRVSFPEGYNQSSCRVADGSSGASSSQLMILKPKKLSLNMLLRWAYQKTPTRMKSIAIVTTK